MPISGERKWREEPFSYTKLCYQAGALMLVVFVAAFAFYSPTEGSLSWILGTGTIVAFITWAKTAGWKLLTDDFRGRIPYDASESHKGTIHSFRDLWRYVTTRSQ